MNPNISLDKRKAQRAWVFYDWANSVFSLVITSTLFPIYYSSITAGQNVQFLGKHFVPAALFSYTISAAFLLVAILSPFLTAIADYSGQRKRFMQWFCYIGSFACLLLYGFDSPKRIEIGIIGFFLGLVGFSGSIVFYNAYLPLIASEPEYDRLSAKGFAWGYVGSVLLLLLCLIPILQPAYFGNISAKQASRFSFVLTALWWMGFAQITFRGLPADTLPSLPKRKQWLYKGVIALARVVRQLRYQPFLRRFIVSFFFFAMGVQTVMYVATLFGTDELHLSAEKLIITILLLQLIAVPGAHLFSWLSGKWGNIRALQLAFLVWMAICVAAYYTYTEMQFYLLAAAVGLVMGGSQALARATYAKLMPDNTPNTAAYFSFYDVSEKIAIVLGTFTYGFIADWSGSMRHSTLALLVFFAVGLLIISFIPSQRVYYNRLGHMPVANKS